MTPAAADSLQLSALQLLALMRLMRTYTLPDLPPAIRHELHEQAIALADAICELEGHERRKRELEP